MTLSERIASQQQKHSKCICLLPKLSGDADNHQAGCPEWKPVWMRNNPRGKVLA